jgi:selenocysteine lyase/cysteine desulfurase
VGARKVEISVDCVAYAPHRRMDVRDWDVDYCVCSLYKVSTAYSFTDHFFLCEHGV